MPCKFKVENSPVYEALKRKFGSDETKLFSYWSTVVKEDEFTSEFQDFVKNKRKLKEDVTLKNANTRTIINDIIQFYNKNIPDGNDSVIHKINERNFNYVSIADRTFCKKSVANEILDIFRDHHYRKFDNNPITIDTYKTLIKQQFLRRLKERLRNDYDVTEDDIKSKMDKQRLLGIINGYIRLGETKQDALKLATIAETLNVVRPLIQKENYREDVDLLATIEEMIDSTKTESGIKISDNFFDEVFNDQRLDEIRRENKDYFGDLDENFAQTIEDDALGEISSDDEKTINDEFDISFRVYSNHDGQYSTFTTHIGGNIRSYLNSLRKLNGTGLVNGKYFYDTRNAIGIADTMSANECATVLYSKADYTNVESMIRSIEQIANEVSGYASFIQLANDLKSNYDFAYEFYRTFGKLVISKKETYVENGILKSRITNNNSNAIDALRFEYKNALKNSSVNISSELAEIELEKLIKQGKSIRESLKTGKKFDAKSKKLIDYNINETEYKIDRTKLISDIVTNLKRFIPTIESSTIYNYVSNNKINGIIDEVSNLSLLVSQIQNIVKGAKETETNYNSIKIECAEAYRHNNQLIDDIQHGIKHKHNEFKDISAIWNRPFLSENAEKAAIQLANSLVPYALPKIELNSRNSKGNLSSDVINSSFLTNFRDMLQSKLNTEDNENSPLRNYGKFKFKTKQYDLSNILVEKIEDGITINRGLFKLVNGEYVPTSYATELLKIALFSGISDYSTGKSLLYSEMSQGDYIATAMVNFNKSTHKHGDITFADYFLQTPSDAPKNFILSAPRYHLTFKENNQLISFYNADGSINRKHPIFRQFYFAFQQEMQNAATAINKLFRHTNGVIEKDVYGNPKFNDSFSQLANPDRATYANYHRKTNSYKDVNGNEVKESGIIQNLWKPIYKEDGSISHYEKTQLKRLSGNIFTSDRFTIFDESTNNLRNYLQEVISEDIEESNDGKIRFLYGGANTYLHINDNGNVEFTAEQQSLIETKIEEFLKDYINSTVNRLSSFKHLLKNIPHNVNDIAEFILNYRLTYLNTIDLFSGDSKFYKNSQDFLKRNKEIQGSGVPYGIVDITKPLTGQKKVLIEKSYLNSDEMQSIVGKLHDCKQYSTFTGVTVTNTIRTSEESQTILVEQLSKNFEEEGLSKKEALKKAKEMMSGYKNTKVNDAQSYITFEEWIRRVSARGQLHRYKGLIERILDESKPLSVSDINEFVQVQKNFYYDMTYNELTDTIAPRQIKNAEFVLVPRLIRGTELEFVYNCMVHYGIDQLNTEETSKAGKTNVLTIWDNDGNLKKEWLKDFDSNIKSAIEVYDYNYLYTQQETPQHLNAENKAGIQIMKKILDNITSDSPLYKYKVRLMENYSYNIYEDFSNLMKELNVEIDKEGNIKIDENGNITGLNYDLLLDKIKDEMIRLGVDSNMMDFVIKNGISTEDNVGQNGQGLNTKMPAYLNSNRRKIESITNAVFNNRITRQKLPGFHAAQITQIGFKPIKDIVKHRIYNNNLRYHPEGENYIQIMLPASNFGLSRNDSKYDNLRNKAKEKNWSNDELEAKIDEAMLADLKLAKADTLIGYRIPTEGKQSVCVMKVVGFVSDAYGSTIVVPDDWVAQTGSDFDIDSVYGIQFTIKKDKDGNLVKVEYNENTDDNYISYVKRNISKEERSGFNVEDKSKENILFIAQQIAKQNNLMSYKNFSSLSISAQNSRDARNNQILQDMINILSSKEALEENVSQSQFKDIIDARDAIMSKIDKLRRNSRSIYDFIDQAEYQDDAMSGAKLKAFSVTRDTFCSVCNTVKPTLSSTIDIIYKGDEKKFKELRKRFDIKEGNKYKGYVVRLDENKILVKHRMFGHSNDNKNVVGKLLTVYSSQTTAHILDAIKEGAIKNVNDLTFAVYKTFPDIGSDYSTAISFMMQPGVSRIVNYYNSNKSIYSTDNKNPINAAITSIAEELKIDTKNKSLQYIEDEIGKILFTNKKINKDLNVLDSELLTNRINESGDLFSTPVKRLLFDYLVIKQYKTLYTIATKISNIARVCNPDRFGAKQTIYSTNKVFDDIKKILTDEEPVFSKDNNKHFLEKIYPGINNAIVNDIDAYINTSNKESVYPSLNNFLKYASATSIKINRTLFLTQHPNFIKAVKTLNDFISFDKTISEETYNKFERYIITSLYNEVDVINKPIFYEYGKGIVTTNGDTYTEIRRIFGYGYSPSLSIGEENIVFKPKDVNKPIEDEISLFSKFTPAQKVFWIQKNFRDGLITKYLSTNLANSNEYRKNIAGQQTISFVNDGIDSETVYSEFNKTFNNNNPLLVMTAMDIIKYAFVVEGFEMKKHAVNKVIDNDILVNPIGFEGTGIISSLDNKVKEFIENFPIDKIDSICEKFIRSHDNLQELNKIYINKNDEKYINDIGNGILTIFRNPENKDFRINKKLDKVIIDEIGQENIISNKYVRITFKNNKPQIYKIYDENDVLFLVPLNSLQETEVLEWSSNPSNNINNSSEYYNDVIEEYKTNNITFDVQSLIDIAKKVELENKDKYKKPDVYKVKKSFEPINFDINDKTNVEIESLRKEIINHFDGTTKSPLILENRFLERHIPAIGIEYGLKKIVNGNIYWIYRINTYPTRKYTREDGLTREISKEDLPLKKLIEKARQRGKDTNHIGQAHVNYAYSIVPYIIKTNVINDESRYSSITERIVAKSDKSIRSAAVNKEDSNAELYVTQSNEKNRNVDNRTTNEILIDTVINTAEYVNSAVDKILNGEHGLNFFIQNPETLSYISIVDPKTLEMIRIDPKLRRTYLKTILDAKNLIDNFSSYATFKYNDDNSELKYYVDKINEAINKLSNSSILQEAEELYVTGYLANISKNPLVSKNILSLLDGYHSTSFLTAQLNDLQETANPLIQIITNDVMSDIRAKEMQGAQRIREFKKFIAQVKEEAKKIGLTVNWDKIVDKYGKFINDYNDKFIEDLENYETKKDEAYNDFVNAKTENEKFINYKKYLQRKLEYNKWKLKHINQSIEDSYYQKTIDNEESMINPNTGKFFDVYVQYRILNNQLGNILSHGPNGELDEYWERKREEVQKEIDNLCSDVIKTPAGTFIYKFDSEEFELSANPEERRKQNINSLSSAVKLRKYIETKNDIDEQYFEKTERFGFREQLKKYLDITQKYEKKDPISGKQLMSEESLSNIPEYVNAKNWIRKNTRRKAEIYNKQETNVSYKEILRRYYDGELIEDTPEFNNRVLAALDYFKAISGERANKNSKYKRIVRDAQAYDENGIVDARKLTDEELSEIKEEQESRYSIGENNAYSERSIIHNSTSDDTIYTSEFYKGMKVEGVTNTEYLEVVKEINEVLRRCLDSSTGVLETSRLTKDEINILLNKLKKLGYNETEQTYNTKNGIRKHKGVNKSNVKSVIDFIEKNVEFSLTEEDIKIFEREKAKAKLNGEDYYKYWLTLNQEWNEETNTFIPNHLFWGHARPKSTLSESERNKFIDKEKTAAIRILNDTFTEKNSKYYDLKYNEMANKYGVNSDEFKTWYNLNHVYNPNKNIYEPLPCWTISETKDNIKTEYIPAYSMTTSSIKEKYRNKVHKENLGIAANYKRNSNSNYDNNNNLNEAEVKIRNKVQEILFSLATTKKAKQYLEKGYLPSRAVVQSERADKFFLKELLKGLGWIEKNNGLERWNDDVSYNADYIPDMPMLQQLVNKDSIRKPYREMFETNEEYEKSLEEYNKNKRENDKKNAEIHKDLLDRNWESVIEEFINKATHYNAIQDNKYQLYFGQKLINDILIYKRRNASNKLKKDGTLSTDEEIVYKKEVDKNLQEQYANWVRRVVFDQFKKNQGKKTRIFQIMQGITSTNYMTLNVRGGIANVTVGESNIWGEVFAKEYLGKKDWLIGKGIWLKAAPSFMANMYSETSTSLADAIFKGFNIVDYDEVTGRVTQKSLSEYSKRLRDTAFSPQTATEHFMQNSVMFSMMNSHRVVPNPKRGQPGETEFVIMNMNEFNRESREIALSQVCTDEQMQDYKRFVEKIKEDPNRLKDYAWFRRDFITDFLITRLNNEQQKEFRKLEKEITQKSKEDFVKHPTLYSQFKLGDDGKLDFAENSLLSSVNYLKDNEEVTEAYKLIGQFKGRVISVNKKIHGNYGKLDAAKIESEWWGGLVMQYHKHIVPGIMKRYRIQGYFNEERGTIEKGSYVALYDLLTLPIKQIAEKNRMSDGETEALTGIQNVFSSIVDYLHFIKLNYQLMSESERGNIRRNLGDIAGMLVALTGAILLKMGYDDDDESFVYNLGLYEMDRLATECFMWNPVGAYAEAKKLWASPVAANSIVGDVFNLLGTTSGMILQGEDYNPYFEGGRYHGEHKLLVYTERRIPYWRNYVALRDIADNNHYYKLGDNLLSVVPVRDIADSITK